MTLHALQTLLEILPTQEVKYTLKADVSGANLSYVDQPNPVFVDPPLRKEEGESATSITIVSAPAAVGKSTLAKELSNRLGALYWDLGDHIPGTLSFTGALDAALGGQKDDLKARLASGESVLILDALDEALLNSPAGFPTFVREICEWVEGEKPALLVFARQQVAEEFAIHVLDNERSMDWHSIGYFDSADTAAAVIDRYLRHDGKNVDPDDEEFERARDLLFSILSTILRGESDQEAWEDPRVQHFLGYAPVLTSIAEFLDVGNPYALAQDLERDLTDSVGRLGGTQKARWELLQRLIGDLLGRERDEKVLPRLEDWLASLKQPLDRSALFRAEEQLARVLGQILQEVGLEEDYMTYLPAAQRNAYEDVMQRQIGDHVLLGTGSEGFANVVFRDYVFAWGLLNLPGAVSALRARLASRFLPTQLFGEFIIFLGSEGDDLRVDRSHTGYVYESLVSEAQKEADLETVISSDGMNAIACSVAPVDNRHSGISFRLAGEETAPVQLWRSLSNARVECHDVVLGFSGQTFRIGPDVELTTNHASLPMETLTLVAQEDNPVTLISDDVTVASHSLQVDAVGRDDAIHIHLDDLRHFPWSKWWFVPAEQPDQADLREPFLTMTRILWWFRSRGYEELGRTRRLMENPSISGGTRGRQMLDFLVEEGILLRNGGYYSLNREKSAALGIHYIQISRREMTEGVSALLQRFLKKKD